MKAKGVLVSERRAEYGEFGPETLKSGQGIVVARPDDEINVAVRLGHKKFFPDDAESEVWAEFYLSSPKDYTWGFAWRLYESGDMDGLTAYLPDLLERIKVQRSVFAAENAAYIEREDRLHSRSSGEAVDDLHGLMKGL